MKSNVYIVGHRILQNKLLALFLQKVTGLGCTCCKESDLDPVVHSRDDYTSLILWDCLGTELDALWTGLGIGLNSKRFQCILTLFNITPKKGIEFEALARGVRGIFFDHDPPSIYAKGVKALIKGEIWYPRQILIECLSNPRYSFNAQREMHPSLTARETEILTMLSSGAPNNEIADELCISRCTVKAHLHNIYTKIDVSNRLQAAIWAAKNF
jgi:LuxR family transcriptional regulator of csgAB operon